MVVFLLLTPWMAMDNEFGQADLYLPTLALSTFSFITFILGVMVTSIDIDRLKTTADML